MKKSFLAVFLISALVMALGLTACGGGEKASSSASSSTSAASSSKSASGTATASASKSGSGASAASASSAAADAAKADGSAYGYAGTDPVEAAVYKYMAEEVSKNFEKADVSIPTVSIVMVDSTDPDKVVVYGDFFVNNYNIDGDTLECVSGGNFPGVMYLSKDGNGYTVSTFDMVEDGASFDSSAKKLFGDYYDDFMKVYSNDEALKELRTATVSDYVKLNGLNVTQYQDYGWDPVKLNK